MNDKNFISNYFDIFQKKAFNPNIYENLIILKNMIIENKLNLFQNYLEDPLNIDIDYTFNLELTINKYFSTNLLLQLLYDDNAIPEIQLKEVFGVSFNINF